MFSSIPGLRPLDASSTYTPSVMTAKDVADIAEISQGQNRPQLGITGLRSSRGQAKIRAQAGYTCPVLSFPLSDAYPGLQPLLALRVQSSA